MQSRALRMSRDRVPAPLCTRELSRGVARTSGWGSEAQLDQVRETLGQWREGSPASAGCGADTFGGGARGETVGTGFPGGAWPRPLGHENWFRGLDCSALSQTQRPGEKNQVGPWGRMAPGERVSKRQRPCNPLPFLCGRAPPQSTLCELWTFAGQLISVASDFFQKECAWRVSFLAQHELWRGRLGAEHVGRDRGLWKCLSALLVQGQGGLGSWKFPLPTLVFFLSF